MSNNATAAAAAATAGGGGGGTGAEWRVRPSLKCGRTHNPIRAIVDNMVKMDGDIDLTLGDPTSYGNFECPRVLVDAVKENVESMRYNGYRNACGLEETRAAIARFASYPGCPEVTAADVVVASGCSGALELAINALVNEGDNILAPAPGFPLYQVLAEAVGGQCRYYRLDPDREWEADTAHMRELVDENTRAIVVTNPSNPCGSVFREEHLREILAVAEELRVPIIADEIYSRMTFPGAEFRPAAALSTEVPVISVGGLAKQFLVPGWRCGWVVVYDRNGILADVAAGLKNMTQLLVGANTLIQSCVPRLLDPTPEDAEYLVQFHAQYMETLAATVEECKRLIEPIRELRMVTPRGAMYAMVGIDIDSFDDISNDREFAEKLLEEERVAVLPGQCFHVDNFFRIVTCAPAEKLQEAFEKIGNFCARHNSAKRAKLAHHVAKENGDR